MKLSVRSLKILISDRFIEMEYDVTPDRSQEVLKDGGVDLNDK